MTDEQAAVGELLDEYREAQGPHIVQGGVLRRLVAAVDAANANANANEAERLRVELAVLRAQIRAAREKCREAAAAGFDSLGLREVEALLADGGSR